MSDEEIETYDEATLEGDFDWESFCNDHHIWEPAAFHAYVENLNLEIEQLDNIVEAFSEAFSGEYDSEKDFAQVLAEETGFAAQQEWPAYCIDWDYAAREIMHDYWSAPAPKNGVFIFRNC